MAGAARNSSRRWATVIQHLPRTHGCLGPWRICFLVLGLKLFLVSPAAPYLLFLPPGLSSTIWHHSLVTPGLISEVQRCSKTSSYLNPHLVREESRKEQSRAPILVGAASPLQRHCRSRGVPGLVLWSVSILSFRASRKESVTSLWCSLKSLCEASRNECLASPPLRGAGRLFLGLFQPICGIEGLWDGCLKSKQTKGFVWAPLKEQSWESLKSWAAETRRDTAVAFCWGTVLCPLRGTESIALSFCFSFSFLDMQN